MLFIIPEIFCDDFECQIRLMHKLKKGDIVITDISRGVLDYCRNYFLCDDVPVYLKCSRYNDYNTDHRNASSDERNVLLVLFEIYSVLDTTD